MDEDAILKAIAELKADSFATRVAIMDRIDRVQNTVEAMRDDITVNFARADRAMTISTNMRSEAQSLSIDIAAMERQIMRLRTELDNLKRNRE